MRDAISVFPNTLKLLDMQLSNAWSDLVDPQIAAMSPESKSAPKTAEWADTRVKSARQGANRWGVKSNKDDPFK